MIDLTHFWNAADHDPVLAQQLADMYIDAVQQTAEQIDDALHNDDRHMVCELVHRLKGSTAILGFSEQQNALDELYQYSKSATMVELTSVPNDIQTLLSPILDRLRQEFTQ
ncbi:Hpt domain-containing protein [Vibrio ulleungensis]|uniref:Hpt domain-containing protein n=1 Tax=Vibrio ulleungensis TaxID=2807619 RepID=A0ABS2HBG1_9VIBR|nr:Hpt domain-containing protein [Vibrio ulleungensis]MBM7034920.1 Hpt domain-containing protein [Vibrio ulleungensis]